MPYIQKNNPSVNVTPTIPSVKPSASIQSAGTSVIASKVIPGMIKLGKEFVTKFTKKSTGLPLPVRGVINDLSGIKRTLTTEDLDPLLKDAYFRAYNTASQREGNTPESGTIRYGDYSVGRSEGGGSFGSQLELLNNPGYQARYTTGLASYKKNPDGTINISDTFDFNDAGKNMTSAEKKIAIDKDLKNIPETAIKDRARVYMRYFGSGSGEGAPVSFNINPGTDELNVPLNKRTYNNPWVKMAKWGANLYENLKD